MNSSRNELMEVLAELAQIQPDVRMGQLISNLAYHARGFHDDSGWEVEDAELLQAAREVLASIRTARSTPV